MTLMTIDASHYPSKSLYGSAATASTDAAAEAYQFEIEEETDELLRQENIQLGYVGLECLLYCKYLGRATNEKKQAYIRDTEENLGLYSMDVKL